MKRICASTAHKVWNLGVLLMRNLKKENSKMFNDYKTQPNTK